LVRLNPIRKPAELEVMNNETLPFVDLVRAAVTIISLKADFNFLRCGFHQIIRSKSRAIRTHDCDAHEATGLVHDPAKRIWSQWRVGNFAIGLLDFPRHELQVPMNCVLTERDESQFGEKYSRMKSRRTLALRSDVEDDASFQSLSD